MKKEFVRGLLSKANMMVVIFMAVMSVGLSSCGDDNGDDIVTVGDFYFSFELVDRGTLSSSDANALMGALNASVTPMDGWKRDEAIYVYNREIEGLRVDYSGNNDFEVTFIMKLMESNKVVKSNVVEIKRSGCTIK